MLPPPRGNNYSAGALTPERKEAIRMNPVITVKRPPPDFFLQDCNHYVFGKTFDDGRKRVGVHGVSALSVEGIRAELEADAQCTINEFSAGYLRGCFVTRGRETQLLLTCDDRAVVADIELFTQSLDSELNHEVQRFAALYRIEEFTEYGFPVFNAVLESYYEVIANISECSVENIYRQRVRNSFRYLSRGLERLRQKDFFAARNHLDWFAWTYHIEIAGISSILGTAQPIVLHDVATNTAFWPCLLATLDGRGLNGMRTSEVHCSDVDVDQINDTMASLKESVGGLEALRPVYLDVTQPSSLLHRADVITANDILEHFPPQASLGVLKNLWQCTRRLLVIHVPFESQPVAAYGHHTAFDRGMLSSWVALLDNCRDRSEELRPLTEGHPDPDAIHKFLFLERIAG
jgi:hypothetical protein